MKLKDILISVITCIFFTMPLYSEYVFLKDGAIVEGAITSDAAGSVSVRQKDKKIKQIPRTLIMRILYTELYMGKVYVQKTDGKNIICFMVDEDRESYTFRKELYSPEEFKLRRDQVLFMARGNPSGLEGEADTDRAELKWFPPYNPVKRYRVYIKGPDDKIFVIADETGSKSTTLKNLKSNTKYQIHVTAMDDAGDESIPSNELSVTTKNLPPDEPVINTVEKLNEGGYKIIWNASADPDGKTAGYRVYRKIDGKYTVIAEMKKTEFSVSKIEDIDTIYLSAFDDLKAESEFLKVYTSHIPEIVISINPAYLYPSGKLKNMTDYGYGSDIKIGLSNYFIPQLELAADASFFYLHGKGDFSESESKLNSIMLIPVMFSAGYAFYPFEHFAIIPNISAGAVYVLYDYNYYDIPASKNKNVIKGEVDPVMGFDLNLKYSLSGSYFITLSTGYRTFFEDSSRFSFLTASIGAGMKF